MNYANALGDNEHFTAGPFQLVKHKCGNIADTFLPEGYVLIFALSGTIYFTCKNCCLSLHSGNFIGIDTSNIISFYCTKDTFLLKYQVKGELSRYISCMHAFQERISTVPILFALNGWIDTLIRNLKDNKNYSEEEYAIIQQNLIEFLLTNYSAEQLGELYVLLLASQIKKVKNRSRTVSVIERNSGG